MPSLKITPNFDRPDDIYDALLKAHESLNEAESAALNARLVLVLANHIGDENAIREAISAAKNATPNNR